MSNTPEDTELREAIISIEFPDGLQRSNTGFTQIIRNAQEKHIDSLMNLIDLHTQKAIENDRTIRDPKVRLWTLNFVYSPTNPMFTQKNVEEYIADLPNPTEAGEK